MKSKALGLIVRIFLATLLLSSACHLFRYFYDSISVHRTSIYKYVIAILNENTMQHDLGAMDQPDILNALKLVITKPWKEINRNIGTVLPSGHYSQFGQSAFVDKLLHNRTNGFFVECGAAEGVYLSNSLFFELKRNWTGILIEVSPNYYNQLNAKRRHAYSLNACLSPIKSVKRFKYQEVNIFGGLTDFEEKSHVDYVKTLDIKSQQGAIWAICYPLYSIMLALGRTHIDYLSLDVEGAELEILRTIPFDKLRIDVIDVEYKVLGSVNDTMRKLRDIRKFFDKTNLYKEVGILEELDVIFQHLGP